MTDISISINYCSKESWQMNYDFKNTCSMFILYKVSGVHDNSYNISKKIFQEQKIVPVFLWFYKYYFK